MPYQQDSIPIPDIPNDELLEMMDGMMCAQVRDWYATHPHNLLSTRLVTGSGCSPKFFQLARMRAIPLQKIPEIKTSDDRLYVTLMELTEEQIDLLMKNPAPYANVFDAYTFVYVELKAHSMPPPLSVHLFLNALSERGSKYHLSYEEQITDSEDCEEGLYDVLSTMRDFHI